MGKVLIHSRDRADIEGYSGRDSPKCGRYQRREEEDFAALSHAGHGENTRGEEEDSNRCEDSRWKSKSGYRSPVMSPVVYTCLYPFDTHMTVA